MVTISAIAAIISACCVLVAAEYCTPAITSGWVINNKPVPLEDVKLSPGVKTWTIDIPARTACYPTYAVGALLVVCEADSPQPLVHLTSAYSGKVTRLSNLWGSATVHTLVFCHEPLPLVSSGLGAAPGAHALAPTVTPQ